MWNAATLTSDYSSPREPDSHSPFPRCFLQVKVAFWEYWLRVGAAGSAPHLHPCACAVGARPLRRPLPRLQSSQKSQGRRWGHNGAAAPRRPHDGTRWHERSPRAPLMRIIVGDHESWSRFGDPRCKLVGLIKIVDAVRSPQQQMDSFTRCSVCPVLLRLSGLHPLASLKTKSALIGRIFVTQLLTRLAAPSAQRS